MVIQVLLIENFSNNGRKVPHRFNLLLVKSYNNTRTHF